MQEYYRQYSELRSSMVKIGVGAILQSLAASDILDLAETLAEYIRFSCRNDGHTAAIGAFHIMMAYDNARGATQVRMIALVSPPDDQDGPFQEPSTVQYIDNVLCQRRDDMQQLGGQIYSTPQ